VKLVLAIQNANLCDLIFLFCISEHARTSAVNARRPKTGTAQYSACDIAPSDGYALAVDGHFKMQFAEKETAIEAATELLAKYPMLQVEIYDASSKSRTLVKQQ